MPAQLATQAGRSERVRRTINLIHIAVAHRYESALGHRLKQCTGYEDRLAIFDAQYEVRRARARHWVKIIGSGKASKSRVEALAEVLHEHHLARL